MTLKTALENRFGSNKIKTIEPKNNGDLPLLLIETAEKEVKTTILSTIGLSNYTMPVSEAFLGKTHNEIYFCLPTYWDLENPNNPDANWVFDWVQRLAKFAVEKETWFGHGHTIPAGNPPQPLSNTMKQDYFMFSNPILLQNELKPIEIDEKTIHFLAIIPLFRKEWLYKSSRNTNLFMKKFKAKGETELLDDYRKSVLEHKFFKWIPF